MQSRGDSFKKRAARAAPRSSEALQEPPVTAAILYDLVQCPHRVSRDLRADPIDRDEINPFIQLLWERGALHEKETIERLNVPFLDLLAYAGDEKERLTYEAMDRREPLIYAGRIRADDLLGNPDLLRKEGEGYVAIDIKSGAGEEGTEDLSKPKKHYAVQLAIYTDILERLGQSSGRHGYIWDINGQEFLYDLTAAQGPRKPESLWDEYQSYLAVARAIIANTEQTLPAYGGVCKLCHWYTACVGAMQDADDLTLIPELGRSRREPMLTEISTIAELAACDPEHYISGKKTDFRGIGADMLRKFHARARLLTDPNGRPYLKEAVTLPQGDMELFFDIEVDPIRDVCYLHGFVERRGGDNATERYVAFFAEQPTAEAEEEAFAQAWRYIQESDPAIIYYYSPYERTHWKKLRERYADVCTEEGIEAMFDKSRAVDLYNDVVRSRTEWPTRDHSIKTLAKYLGFNLRDTNPSGAASIEWFHRWVESGDPKIRQRILDYNEDDCRATRVLLDGIRALM